MFEIRSGIYWRSLSTPKHRKFHYNLFGKVWVTSRRPWSATLPQKGLHCKSCPSHFMKFLQNSFFIEHLQKTALEYKLWQQEHEKELFLIITNVCFPCLYQVTKLSPSHLNVTKPSSKVKINELQVNTTIIYDQNLVCFVFLLPLHCKSIDWFLYDENIDLEWVHFYSNPIQARKLGLTYRKRKY